MRGLFYSALGVSFAVAGYDKVFGTAYDKLARHWGWSRDAMQATGVGELAGGLMMLFPNSRRIGAGVLTGTSAVVLEAEVERKDAKLAFARFTLLALAASALLSRRRH